MEDPDYGRATDLLDSALEEALRLIYNEGRWEPVDENDGIIVSKIPSEDGPILVKTVARLNKPLEQVFEFLWTFSNKKITDSILKEIRAIKSFDDTFRILYEESSPPWPITNRDFVYAERQVPRDDGIFIIRKSIEGVLPEIKDIIRAEIVINGTYLKRVSDSVTELISVSASDLKGSIPSIAKNKMAGRQIDRVIALRKALG
jgi:START domain.